MMEDLGAVGSLQKIGADIGRRRSAVVTGITQVLGIVRITAVTGDVVPLHPQAREILHRRAVVRPAVRPVAIDAGAALVGTVRRKSRTVLAAGPEQARHLIEVRTGRRVREGVALQTYGIDMLAQDVTVALAAVRAAGIGEVRRVTGQTGHLAVGVERQQRRCLKIAARNRHTHRVRTAGAGLHVSRAVADQAHLVQVVRLALIVAALSGAGTAERRRSRVERGVLLAMLIMTYRAHHLRVSGIETAVRIAGDLGQPQRHLPFGRIIEIGQTQIRPYAQCPAVALDKAGRPGAIDEVQQQPVGERDIAAADARSRIAGIIAPVKQGRTAVAAAADRQGIDTLDASAEYATRTNGARRGVTCAWLNVAGRSRIPPVRSTADARQSLITIGKRPVAGQAGRIVTGHAQIGVAIGTGDTAARGAVRRVAIDAVDVAADVVRRVERPGGRGTDHQHAGNQAGKP